ncbi:MAG: right-handed parallel beta-helix repeat-containing protein [Ignavibacteriales bacterium]|nr:right-handed parallel beta-helix repeat-containing protein [Ignavibacteriales bacterium]
MKRIIIIHLLFLVTLNKNSAQRSIPIELHAGLVISNSVIVKPQVYSLSPPSSTDSSVITIRGDNITVDFAGATLRGKNGDEDPDTYSGVAIRIEGGKNIRIINAHIHGYKIAILVRGTDNLELIDNDVSYNWKPRLFSLIEHESLLDWLSFHHNEKDEWLRYGAGIYLSSVNGGIIRNNICVQGMNGLLITRSNHIRITGNNFSFNSGLGIGLYRSCNNEITYNKLDYNVRGYSHGFYNRGQDSANLLLYEQSSNNVIAYNSATHGGDGFFLWAGQTTMDSGKGGSNDNLLYGNDFSFASANGIEATFSRNSFISNRLAGCDYGIWGGYSYESKIVGNQFENNRVGVAIEHGQDNSIIANRFHGDTTAVTLWATPIAPSDWGYPKYRDTRSRDYKIEKNIFEGNKRGTKVLNTSGIALLNNQWMNVDTATIFRDTTDFDSEGNTLSDSISETNIEVPKDYLTLAPKIDSRKGVIPAAPISKMDRSAIIVDEWGPYDYQSPKLWPVKSLHELPLRLRTLGPKGNWSVIQKHGIEMISAVGGKIGDTITVTPMKDSIGNWSMVLNYQGESTTSPRGKLYAEGTSYQFSFEHFAPSIDWNVRFFTWTDSTNPLNKYEAFNQLLGTQPILIQQVPRLDFEWYRPKFPELPQERFAFEAEGSVILEEGIFTLRTISDDGVRVWVDDALVIDNWSQHGSKLDYAIITGGRHRLRVQYFQVDGWMEFRLDILRGINRSIGSPE